MIGSISKFFDIFVHVQSCFAGLALLAIASPRLSAASNEVCEQEPSSSGNLSLLAWNHKRTRAQRQFTQKLDLLDAKNSSEQESVLQDDAGVGANQFRSTPDGVCMYDLPAKFNLGLLDTHFSRPEPQPAKIAPSRIPPLQGMYDTDQFWLERIFFDRMQSILTETRAADRCEVFYVPYFVAWETGPINGLWTEVNRPKLDEELFTRLTYFNAGNDTLPEKPHFIIVGRIAKSMKHLLWGREFKRMIKFGIEDSYAGFWSPIFAIPYPTWFRYDRLLEASNVTALLQQSISSVSASYLMQASGPNKSCDPNWLGNLTSQMTAACNGKMWCSFWLQPRDPVANALAASKLSMDPCPVVDVTGTYTCGQGLPEQSQWQFKTNLNDIANGRAVVLSCNRGPDWLLDTSMPLANQSGEPTGMLPELMRMRRGSGPLVSLIGSVRADGERARNALFDMCQQRPTSCARFDTGSRENSTSFMDGRVADMYQLISASTFCLNANGDSPTRKGLFDSLVLGCIPVVTSEDSLNLYRLHIPIWSSVCILVTTDQLYQDGFNVVDYLESYARDYPQLVTQKQVAIRKAAYSLQYSVGSESEPHLESRTRRGPDAFDIVLEQLKSPSNLKTMLSEMSRRKDTEAAPAFEIEDDAMKGSGAKKMFFNPLVAAGLELTVHTEIGQSIPNGTVWQVRGDGDGSCCYRLYNPDSNHVLGSNKDGFPCAFDARPSWQWPESRWRFTQPSELGYAVTNVETGLRLFVEPGTTVSAALLGQNYSLILASNTSVVMDHMVISGFRRPSN